MPSASSRYAERLSVPWWSWPLAAFLVASLGLAFLVALGPLGSLALVVVVGILTAWGLRSAGAVVEVVSVDGEETLVAGRAHIPVRLTGSAVALDAARAAHVRGPGINPAAYHLLRGWVAPAVLVEVLDPADPTPYWYVSSREPDRLVAALNAARPDAARPDAARPDAARPDAARAGDSPDEQR